MRSYSNITAYRKENKVITTTKLHGRRQQVKPHRGVRFIRSLRDWFGMCWGRRDHEEMNERERLLDEDDDDTEKGEDSDSEDERLIGPEGREQRFVPRRAALSSLRSATGKCKVCRGWRY